MSRWRTPRNEMAGVWRTVAMSAFGVLAIVGTAGSYYAVVTGIGTLVSQRPAATEAESYPLAAETPEVAATDGMGDGRPARVRPARVRPAPAAPTTHTAATPPSTPAATPTTAHTWRRHVQRHRIKRIHPSLSPTPSLEPSEAPSESPSEWPSPSESPSESTSDSVPTSPIPPDISEIGASATTDTPGDNKSPFAGQPEWEHATQTPRSRPTGVPVPSQL